MGKRYSREDLIQKLYTLSEKEVQGKLVHHPSEVYEVFKAFGFYKVEHFFIATLDTAHRVIKTHVITKGIANKTIVHPREVFVKAVEDRASAIILGHNHPSGTLEASYEDLCITKRLHDAGEILGISVLDHLIVTRDGYFSFTESGTPLNAHN